MKAIPSSQADPWQHALDAIAADETATLVAVVDHSGSVPGVTGTCMVVTDRAQTGTVGGGIAEHAMAERARRFRNEPELVEFVHTESAEDSLCNGVQLFCLMPLARSDAGQIERIVDCLRAGAVGMLRLGPNGFIFDADARETPTFTRDGDDWSFAHPLGLRETLTIIGGGHVALALSRIMATLPFRISILDNRTDLEIMESNPFAHCSEVVDYDTIASHVPEGDDSWVVIMTHGHAHDRQVAQQLLGLELRYLGLMGSKAKVATLYSRMIEAGYDPGDLAQLRTPVGVPINSHTPEEIAVSIAAEIIGIRNGAID